MGRIISTSSTNTLDTNTSRRQVKTHTHISTTTTTTTTLHQIQTYHEVYWIDCIYFDASSCCYGFNSFCKVHCISRTSILLQCHRGKVCGMQGWCIGGGNLQNLGRRFI